jgi:hypothetical protein
MGERGSAAAISVVLDQPVIHAGCEVTGKVYLSVYQEELMCESIAGRIIGQEMTVVSYNKSIAHTAHDAWNFMDTDFRIHDIKDGVFRCGQYGFPFSFTTPATAPATMDTWSRQRSGFIKYTVEVWLDRPGYHRDFVQQETITVIPTSIRDDSPLSMEPQSLHLRSLSYFNRGNVLLSWRAEQNVLYAGGTTSVKFAALNLTGVPVVAFDIRLTEFATFSAHEQSNTTEKRLFRTIVSSETAGFQSGFTRRVADPQTAARQLSEALTSQGSVDTSPVWTVRITVPDNAASSHHGRLIQIRHELTVKVVTTLGSSNVRMTQQVKIVNAAVATGAGTPKSSRAVLVDPALVDAPPAPWESRICGFGSDRPAPEYSPSRYTMPAQLPVAYSGHAQAVAYPYGGMEDVVPCDHVAVYVPPVAHEYNGNKQAADFADKKIVASAPPT